MIHENFPNIANFKDLAIIYICNGQLTKSCEKKHSVRQKHLQTRHKIFVIYFVKRHTKVIPNRYNHMNSF